MKTSNPAHCLVQIHLHLGESALGSAYQGSISEVRKTYLGNDGHAIHGPLARGPLCRLPDAWPGELTAPFKLLSG